MRSSGILVASMAIALLKPIVSSAFVTRAYATTGWVGNDNGEVDCNSTNSCTPNSNSVKFSTGISTTISYSSTDGEVSFQYNPDWDTSKSYQTGADWFQTGIIGDKSSSCAIATVQVYDTSDGSSDWSWYSNSDSCTTVSDLFTTDSNGEASWGITEDTDSSGYVNEVDFVVIGGTSGGGSYYVSAYPENGGDWYWLRSNTCWCGVATETATFSAGAGTIDYTVNTPVDLYAYSPPTQVSTGENSNMDYGCFTGGGTSSMSQSFGLSGHC